MNRIAMVTTCKGRVEHIRQTLPRNLADNKSFENAVFVVVDYTSEDGLAGYLRRDHARDISSGRLVVYRYDEGEKFHISHAKNIAARCGLKEGADILVTLDADNFTGPNFAQFVEDRFSWSSDVPGIFLCPDHLHIQSLPHGPGRPQRGFAGRLAVWGDTFVSAGGYDETYDTWRGEDIDMNFRLERMGYTRRFFENRHLNTIPHGAAVRFKEYPHAKQFENPDEVKHIRARTQTVVNFGHFGVAQVRRNYGHELTELAPVPTRIFGIGLHKTATTSLHRALQMLGFDSLHWGTGEAPMIWQEMNALGRSRTLEQFYALSDLPIPLLYQQLDKAYPGSKFILTVRDEVDWLQSVRNLWDARRNPTRHLWEIYPISHTLHTALYGRKDFDAIDFLARYRRHNAEVREYFKNRPKDLLVLEAPDWKPLCKFLGCKIPGEPYPMANRTRRALYGRY